MGITATKDLLGQAAELFKQVKEIATNPDATTEERNKIEGMLDEARSLKAKGLQLQEIEDSAKQIEAELEKKQAGEKKLAPSNFKSWGNFLSEVHNADNPKSQRRPHEGLVFFQDEKGDRSGVQEKDMAEATGAAGGYLVPTEYQNELMSIASEDSIVRSRATIIPMRRRAIKVPVLDQTDTTANQPHWFGGIQIYWEEEAGEKTQSDPTFRQIELIAHKMIGYTRASDELLDDSAISLDAFLRGPLGFGGAMKWTEDYVFLRGTGAGQPLGIINAGATIIEGRAAAGTIGFDDIADMMEDFLPSGRGIWTITQSAMSELIQMNGPAGNPSYIWQPNARDGVPGYLMGMPVKFTEKLPRIGTQGDILLADMKYYLIGDRQAITVDSTKFDRWRYDQTSWRIVSRIDGQPWLSAPLTYDDGTTQVSPFVILGGVVGS